MKNILVTIDLEDSSRLLIRQATELAEKFSAKIWLLHITAPEPDFVGDDVGPQYIRDFRADEIRQEHRMLRTYTDELKSREIEADGLLISGATIEMILHEAHKLKADLLVIGHHKHGWLHKIYAGTTDTAIINKSSIPVLVVPVNK